MLPLLVLPWDNPIFQNHLYTSPLLLPWNSMKKSSQLPDACNANASQLVANTPLTLPPQLLSTDAPMQCSPWGRCKAFARLALAHRAQAHALLMSLCPQVWANEQCVYTMCITHVLRHILHRQHLVLHLVLRLTSRSSHNFPTTDKVLPHLPHSARLV